MPFQISTRPSRPPCQPIISLNAAAREHEVAARLADHAVAVAPAHHRVVGRVRRAHRDLDARLGPQRRRCSTAWTSEPPASGSSRSRHARMLTRSSPASPAMSPSLATSSVVVGRGSSPIPERARGEPRGLAGPEHDRETLRPRHRHAAGTRTYTAPMARLTGERPMAGRHPRLAPRVPRRGVPRDPGAARARAPCSTSGAASARRRSASPRRTAGSSASTTTPTPRSTPSRALGDRRGCGSRRWTAPSSASGDRTIDWVCSSHIIEHFDDARTARRRARTRLHRRRHRVRDHARTALPTSRTRSTCTCSRPTSWSRCCACSSTTSQVHGLEGSPELHDDFARRRASGEKLLQARPAPLRQRVPRSWYV